MPDVVVNSDSHAQFEIRVYADVMLDLVKKWVPLTYEAFEDYRMGGTELSAKEIKLMRKLLQYILAAQHTNFMMYFFDQHHLHPGTIMHLERWMWCMNAVFSNLVISPV